MVLCMKNVTKTYYLSPWDIFEYSPEIYVRLLSNGRPEFITVFGGGKVKSYSTVSIPVGLEGSQTRRKEFLITDVDQANFASFLCNSISRQEKDLESLNSEFEEICNDDFSHISALPKFSVRINEKTTLRYIRACSVSLRDSASHHSSVNALRAAVDEQWLAMLDDYVMRV
ncbi:unnamed protein product [Lepeophtheirus salmonis]|uniref:(salmon louse) hypothetical protein n=1 Tax=Lepeophtheirus salmonis TaxID=72036 RepID=A0A7R8CSQ9_LEPSM|nr:unnamed protein product [Lepeophtheirus salmonis]CAF2916350.1 unnamed protein product [Lepeophtheirus salmonis]